MKSERQSNIELTRIFAIIGVFIMHYVNKHGGGGILYAKGINLFILYVLVSVFVCAVNLFMLISGYFMCQTYYVSIWKPIKLIIQVMVFSCGLYILRWLIFGKEISVKGFIGSLIPANYFVILYSVTFLLAPYLNRLLHSLSQKERRVFILLFLCLFSLYPTVVDVFFEMIGHQWMGLSSIGAYGSQWGYSIVNFVLMYMIGAFLRYEKENTDRFRTKWLIISFIGCVAIMSVWAKINDYTGYLTERTAWEYCNPIVILAAAIAFLLFSRLEIGVNKTVNIISNGVFSVYLLHGAFLGHIGVENAVQENPIFMVGHMLFSAVAVYVVCLAVHYIYTLLSAPFFKKLERSVRLPGINLES